MNRYELHWTSPTHRRGGLGIAMLREVLELEARLRFQAQLELQELEEPRWRNQQKPDE